MKLLRKIAPLAITLVMCGATVAAADLSAWKASFPGTDTAIVVGAGAAAQDTLGAVHIANALGVTGGGQAPIEGAWLVRAPGSDLELYRWFQDVKETISDDELPTILSEGTYRESRGENENEQTYTQKLIFDSSGNTNAMVFAAKDDSKKKADYYLYLDDSSGVKAYTYELSFDTAIKYDTTSAANLKKDFQLSKIKMLGREYTFVDAKDRNNDNKVDELILMAGVVKASQWEYSKATYTLAGKSYEVEAKIISDTDSTAILVINGEETSELGEGATYTLDDGTRVGIVDVIPNEGAEEGKDLVTFYLGAEKILFKHGYEVEINGVAVDGSNVIFDTPSVDELKGITLEMVPDDKVYVAAGESWVDPILGRFKYTFQGLEKKTEKISATSDGDDGVITVLNNAGKKLEIPVVFDDSSEDVYPGDEIDTAGAWDLTVSGDTSEGNLVLGNFDVCTDTAGPGNLDGCKDKYFIAVSSGGEAHLIKITKIDENDDKITFRDITKDKTYDPMPYTGGLDTFNLFTPVKLTIDESGNTVTFNTINNYNIGAPSGQALFQTKGAADVLIWYDASGANTVVDVEVYKNDAWGTTPLFYGASGSGGGIEFVTDGNPSPEMKIEVGTSGLVCDGPAMAKSSCPLEKNSDWKAAVDDGSSTTSGYSWGAYVTWNDDEDNEVNVEYPEDQVIAKVYVSEVLTTIPELATGGAVGAATPVLDIDVRDVKNMNLIIVGGSAINRVAAEALGVTFPTYGTDAKWQDATKVNNAGKAIIKLMNSPYATGKFAMLVAGWEGIDTERAAKVLREGTPAISGQSVLLNTATSTVTVITA